MLSRRAIAVSSRSLGVAVECGGRRISKSCAKSQFPVRAAKDLAPGPLSRCVCSAADLASQRTPSLLAQRSALGRVRPSTLACSASRLLQLPPAAAAARCGPSAVARAVLRCAVQLPRPSGAVASPAAAAALTAAARGRDATAITTAARSASTAASTTLAAPHGLQTGAIQAMSDPAAPAAAAAANAAADGAAAAPQPPARRKPMVVIVTGPTAVGKTAISLQLAQRLRGRAAEAEAGTELEAVAAVVAEGGRGEVISADSVQVYRGLDVGSDKVRARGKARVGCECDEIGFGMLPCLRTCTSACT